MYVKIHKLDPSVAIPEFKTKGAVGFDLAASSDMHLPPREIALVPTGLVIEVPPGYALIIASRSSTPRKKKITMPHGIGIIDQDYCGPSDEIKIQVRNFTDEEITIKRGERIAQGLFVRAEQVTFEEILDLSATSRGGFGSTG
jgi:dUTP pyrophosphatase